MPFPFPLAMDVTRACGTRCPTRSVSIVRQRCTLRALSLPRAMCLHKLAPPVLVVDSPGSSSNRTAVRNMIWIRVNGIDTIARYGYQETSGLGKSGTSFMRQLQREFGVVFLWGDAVRQ